MHKMVRSLWLLVCGLFCSNILFAQAANPEVDMMRSSGKIYVVVIPF